MSPTTVHEPPSTAAATRPGLVAVAPRRDGADDGGMDPAVQIRLEDVGISFVHSYDRALNLRAHLRWMAKRALRGHRPKLHHAVDGVTLDIREGEVVGIIGPNGCGKSTLLRTMSGIYWPDRGRVVRRGRVSALLSLGTGFDNEQSGRANILLNGMILGMSREEIEARVDEVVRFADIGDHIDMPMKFYSSGMISRVGFAIVLAMRPDVILVDEVFSVGDLAFSRKAEGAMDTMLGRASCQVLVSHDLGLIETRCTRVIRMQAGRIIDDGDPVRVVADYRREAGG